MLLFKDQFSATVIKTPCSDSPCNSKIRFRDTGQTAPCVPFISFTPYYPDFITGALFITVLLVNSNTSCYIFVFFQSLFNPSIFFTGLLSLIFSSGFLRKMLAAYCASPGYFPIHLCCFHNHMLNFFFFPINLQHNLSLLIWRSITIVVKTTSPVSKTGVWSYFNTIKVGLWW